MRGSGRMAKKKHMQEDKNSSSNRNPQEGKKLYRVSHMGKLYHNIDGDKKALEDITFDIEEGKVIVILGPSGSGKSTLLNVLSGIDQATEGEIYFDTQKLSSFNEKELTSYRKDYLGFIFQSYHLISSLTVTENVELGLHLSSNPLNMEEILSTVGLQEHRKKYPYQLSGGQMQRVAIARALVKNPKVLFCDEPTGALDEETGKKILEALQTINRKYRTTMIIVTHNPSLADMAHMVIKVNSGRIIECYHNEQVKDAKDLRWA